MENSKQEIKKVQITNSLALSTELHSKSYPCSVIASSVNNGSLLSNKTTTKSTIPTIQCQARQLDATSSIAHLPVQSTSWMNNYPQTRGNLQVQIPGNSFFPPPMYYGYFPAYHSVLSNSITDYLTMDPTLFLRRQKPRTIFNSDQLRVLEATFKKNNYPNASTRKDVADKVGLPVDRVRVWFQNRRAKEKRLKEDRLALSLLTDSPTRNVIPTSRFPSELLLQRINELHSHDKETSSDVDVEHNPETEENLVRNLLKEARAREEARQSKKTLFGAHDVTSGNNEALANSETKQRLEGNIEKQSRVVCKSNNLFTSKMQFIDDDNNNVYNSKDHLGIDASKEMQSKDEMDEANK